LQFIYAYAVFTSHVGKISNETYHEQVYHNCTIFPYSGKEGQGLDGKDSSSCPSLTLQAGANLCVLGIAPILLECLLQGIENILVGNDNAQFAIAL
jgi:hypothetical protein